MKRIALAVALLGILGAACGTAGAGTEPTTETVTVTAPPTVTEVTPIEEPVEPVVPEIQDESNACRHMERASNLPAYSSRWDDVVLDAQDAAVGDVLYSKLVRVYDTIEEPGYDYEQVASERLDDAIDTFC